MNVKTFKEKVFNWILDDYEISYGASLNYHVYLVHCKQTIILPIKLRFDCNDLKCSTPLFMDSRVSNRLIMFDLSKDLG